MDQYKIIRHLYSAEGLSKREIAKRLGISRNTVARYCDGSNVPWERKPSEGKTSVVTQAVRDFILKCFEQDKIAPRKQHHTARRIYERLRDESGFVGGESTIRSLVAEMKAKMPTVFIPLAFSPGEAAQVDWGTATVVMAGKKIEVNLFCIRLCFSCAPLAIAYPSQRTETFFEGHLEAFHYFGGVPKKLIYDNLRTAVKDGWGKHANEQDKFLAFRAHHAYEPEFCNPAEGHEKGLVENLVGYIRRNVLVPIPEVSDWEELNALLLERCQRYRDEHHIRGRELPVRDDYAMEKLALTLLPAKPYDAAKLTEPTVNYFATVSFETNHYSVPVTYAGYTVTVKASAFSVDIYYRNQHLARHGRCYGKNQTRYHLKHYLPLLEIRPRAVRNARPVRDANLPQELWDFVRLLKNPDKNVVRLLRLVVDYGIESVVKAIKKAMQHHQYSFEVVDYYVKTPEQVSTVDLGGPVVRHVDLHGYDCLLAGGNNA